MTKINKKADQVGFSIYDQEGNKFDLGKQELTGKANKPGKGQALHPEQYIIRDPKLPAPAVPEVGAAKPKGNAFSGDPMADLDGNVVDIDSATNFVDSAYAKDKCSECGCTCGSKKEARRRSAIAKVAAKYERLLK